MIDSKTLESVQLAARQYGSHPFLWDSAAQAHLPWVASPRPQPLQAKDVERWYDALQTREEYLRRGLQDFVTAEGTSEDLAVRACGRYLLRYMSRKTPFLWIFALPGMGKTTLARTYPAVIDMDYGIWRRNCGSRKQDMHPDLYAVQLAEFMDACAIVASEIRKKYALARTVILCNELDLIPFVLELGHPLIMVIPDRSFIPTWLEGVAKREDAKRDLGMVTDFDHELHLKHEVWLKDWEACSAAYRVPLWHATNWLPLLAIDSLICEGCRSRT